ncbi:MAG: hypothetical protein ACYC61_26770 [Isosphaeraceae bacterium]
MMGHAFALLGVTAIILGVGLLLYRAIGRGSPGRRLHGRFVLAGAVLGYLVGGVVGLHDFANGRHPPNENGAWAALGLVAGLMLGQLIGGLAVLVMACRRARRGHATVSGDVTMPPMADV